jgi:hypothetical protein
VGDGTTVDGSGANRQLRELTADHALGVAMMELPLVMRHTAAYGPREV